VGISPGFGEISKGLWKEGEACFWLSTLSTAPPFPQLSSAFLMFCSFVFAFFCAACSVQFDLMPVHLGPPRAVSELGAWLRVTDSRQNLSAVTGPEH
jgi:hypothetical protein